MAPVTQDQRVVNPSAVPIISPPGEAAGEPSKALEETFLARALDGLHKTLSFFGPVIRQRALQAVLAETAGEVEQKDELLDENEETECRFDPEKAGLVLRPFVEWFTKRSVGEKLTAMAFYALAPSQEYLQNHDMYDGLFQDEVLHAWEADVDAAAEAGQLTQEELHTLEWVRILDNFEV